MHLFLLWFFQCFQVSSPSFQDGRRACGQRSPSKWRLDVQDRPKGCVFHETCLQRAQAPFAFHLGLNDVSVYMSSVWPGISASSFHQGPTTSSGLPSPKRGEVCGRSPHYGWQQGPSSHAVCCSNTVARIPGLPGELLKISDTASTGISLLGPQDSRTEELSLPHQKSSEIRKQARKLLRQTWVSAREIAEFVGKLLARALAIHPSPLHYQSLQHLKHQALRGSQNYSSLIHMSAAAKEDIEWWIHEVSKWNGRSLQATSPELEIETDASLTGWGAYCQGNLTGGRWSEEEQSLHINELKLLAAQFALRAFLKNVRDVSVLLKSDNVTTVAYINHLGGTRSGVLVNISKELWLWCLQRGIALKAQHLPGKENLNADFMSRHLRDRTDWILNPALFNLINQMWGPLQVDLFATRFSRQLPRYFSWRPDPEAEATDAFLQDWRNLQAYAHPPWCLIARAGKGSFPESNIGPGNSMLADTAMVSSAYGNVGGFPPSSPRPSPVPGGHAFPQLRLPSTNNPTSVGRMEGLRGQL